MSSTLKSKQIATYRKNNNLSVYNFGLGENPLKPPDYFVDMVKQFSHKKSYSIKNVAEMFKSRIIYLKKRQGERYASALTKISLNNKVFRRFGKINLKDYITSFIKG